MILITAHEHPTTTVQPPRGAILEICRIGGFYSALNEMACVHIARCLPVGDAHAEPPHQLKWRGAPGNGRTGQSHYLQTTDGHMGLLQGNLGLDLGDVLRLLEIAAGEMLFWDTST